ncbi:MAG: TolC family protein [Proteobacteria bacterium]|nr:TolC family protein [Pseudomonadota bacterium]
MKTALKYFITSAICAAVALPAISASAKPSKKKKAEEPAPVVAPIPYEPVALKPADQMTYEDLNPEGVAIYDPALLDPEVSKGTTERTQAARATLEQTHNSPMPGRKFEGKMQALPGEEFLSKQVSQISELNEIKPGPALTLKEALLMADAENLDLQAARVKLETTQAQLKQAWAMLLPNISASLSYAHMSADPTASSKAMMGGIMEAVTPVYTSLVTNGLLDPSVLAGLSFDSPEVDAQNPLSVGLTVGLSIINVSGWFTLRMLDEVKDLTALGIEDGRQQLLSGVAQAYMAALLCGEVVKVQRVQLKSALDQLTIAQGRYERGADVKLSVIQAQFAVEKQRQALIDAIWSYETARDALANVLNTDGLPVPQPTHIKAVNSTSDEALEQEAIDQNRTLQMNRMTQEINRLNLNSAIADFMPTLSGAWQYSYNFTDPVSSSSWTLALSLNIPLFDYSKFGVLDERKAAIRETELAMESTENSTRNAVRKAKREYYSALFNVDNAKRQVELAREALALTEAAYKNGASTFIDVSDARNSVAAASIAYVTAGIQAELSLVSLISTLGRDIMEVVY